MKESRVKKVLALVLLMPCFTFAADPVYCNGQRKYFATDEYYPNGQRVTFATDNYYPNGQRTTFATDRFYPNGQVMKFASDQYYMSGQRVKFATDLFYPNGQLVSFATTCYYENGVVMDPCPERIKYVEHSQGFRIRGVLERKTGRITLKHFEHRERGVITTFEMDEQGKITNIDAICR